MSTLYNVYICGLQAEYNNQVETVISQFSRQFANRTPKLLALLKSPQEQCFFAKISEPQATELQRILSVMGLRCKYRPAESSEQSLKLIPLDKDLIRCPYCGCQQKRPADLPGHHCKSCGSEMILFERRRKINNRQRFLDLQQPLDSPEPSPTTTAIERAISVEQTKHKSSMLYYLILGFTVMSILLITALALWQSGEDYSPELNHSIDTVDRAAELPQHRIIPDSQKNTISTASQHQQPIDQLTKILKQLDISLPTDTPLINNLQNQGKLKIIPSLPSTLPLTADPDLENTLNALVKDPSSLNKVLKLTPEQLQPMLNQLKQQLITPTDKAGDIDSVITAMLSKPLTLAPSLESREETDPFAWIYAQAQLEYQQRQARQYPESIAGKVAFPTNFNQPPLGSFLSSQPALPVTSAKKMTTLVRQVVLNLGLQTDPISIKLFPKALLLGFTSPLRFL